MHQNGQINNQDPRYQEPTFQQYCSDPGAPRSFKAFISAALKARVAGYVKSIPRLLLTMVPFTILSIIFNVYFWSVINDTMWAGSGTWGRISFMPYLIGGSVYSGSWYKGVTPFEMAGITPMGKVVAPLTFGLSLLFSRLVMRKKQGGPGAISRDFSSVKELRDHYEKILGVEPRPAAPVMNNPVNPNMPYNPGVQGMPNNQGMPQYMGNPNMANNSTNKSIASTNGYVDLTNLPNNIYMRLGLCCAIIFGFIIRNPFAVPVFATLLYFTFGQGGQSDIGQMFFRVRSADGRLYDGRKQTFPRYSEGMLIIYYMSIGLFMYTALNVVLWFLFRYNFYFRFLISGGLVAAILVIGGGGKKQIAGMISTILMIVGGFLLFGCVAVFADDNGWSESGRTIGGLMRNNGFPKSLLSSTLPAIFWDLGILFGWPPEILLPPVPAYVPPQPPAPVNPYDFPGRPKEWSLNDEGDVSFVDPITRTRKQYGLVGYDENGNPKYIGENGSYYDLDELLESYDNATRNTEYYQDANKGLKEWLEKQRAENQKLSRDGLQYLKDKWEWEAKQAKEEKEAEQLFKMWQKYGGELDNKDSIKAAMEKAIGKAKEDAEYNKKWGDFWDKATTAAEYTEKIADYSLTGLSIMTGNTTIKKYYDITKNYASKMTDAYVNDKSMSMAFASATAETLIDHYAGELGDKGWHFTGNIGGEVTKQIWSNLEEGKDWNDSLGSATFKGVVKGGIDKIGSKIKESQQDYTKNTFKNDTAFMDNARKNGLSIDGERALENLRMNTWANNKSAEKALEKATDLTGETAKTIFDGVTEKMGDYERDFDAESRESFLKEVADKKAEYVKMQKEQAKLAEEKAIRDHRQSIIDNAQKPI